MLYVLSASQYALIDSLALIFLLIFTAVPSLNGFFPHFLEKMKIFSCFQMASRILDLVLWLFCLEGHNGALLVEKYVLFLFVFLSANDSKC